jgi:hypothetical protein
MSIKHVVITNEDGIPTGRARIDTDKCLQDNLDYNNQGWEKYRTARGRVVLRWQSQWANIPDKWVGDPREVAAQMAELGWELDDDDASVTAELEEV